MFKIGDKVRFKSGAKVNKTASRLYPPDLTEAEVIALGSFNTVVVSVPSISMHIYTNTHDIEYVPALPKGTNNEVFVDDLETWHCADSAIIGEPKTCDCGGYSIYASYQSECHSSWCSSQQ